MRVIDATALGKVVIDRSFSPRDLKLRGEFELWSMAFRAIEEFDAVVEGDPNFQDAMGNQPIRTAVYFEPDFD